MNIIHVVPQFPAVGKATGQVKPRRVLRHPGAFPEITKAELTQGSDRRGNVVAFRLWVSDVPVAIARTSGRPEDSSYTEYVRINPQATWAYCVTWVEVAGVPVSHPMVTAAYAADDTARQWLLTKRLPLYRCIGFTFRGLFANMYLFNGGRTYEPVRLSWVSMEPYAVDPAFWGAMPPASRPRVDNGSSR